MFTPPDWKSEHMAITGAKPTVVPWKGTPLKSTQKDHEMALRHWRRQGREMHPAYPTALYKHTVSGEHISSSSIFKYRTLQQNYKVLRPIFLGLYFTGHPVNPIFCNGLVMKSAPAELCNKNRNDCSRILNWVLFVST